MRCAVISFALRLIAFVILAVVSSAAIMGASSLAVANDRAIKDSTGREAVLGTFHIRPKPVEGARRRASDGIQTHPSRDGLVPEFSDLSTKHLLHIFANANDALQNGDRARAQRLYERVIAARPNSRLADAARKELANLYRETARPPDDNAAHDRDGAPVHGSRQDAVVYGPARPDGARAARLPDDSTRRRRQRSRRVVMLERQFIAEVGDRVFFARGSAELGLRARDVLAQQAAWLHRYPDLVVTVEGHADDGLTRPHADFELALSRAEAVRRGLVEVGVSASRITTKSLAREKPVAQCDGAQCAAQNRRVVTVIADSPVRTARETVPTRASDLNSDPILSAAPAPPSPPEFDRRDRRPSRAFR